MLSSVNSLVHYLRLDFYHIKIYNLDHTWSITSRRLDHSVFWYVLKGNFNLSIAGIDYKVHPEELLFLPPHTEFSCSTSSSDLRIISLNFRAEITLSPHRIWSELLRFPTQLPFQDNAITGIVQTMLDIEHGSATTKMLLLQAKLLELVAYLLEKLAASAGSISSAHIAPTDRRIQLIDAYISRQTGQLATVQDLCKLVQLSESYLRKLFMAQTGMSPLNYIHYVKMEQAKERLVRTEDRVLQIAQQLGYENPNYFSRMFKQRSGITPNEYRGRHRL